jgi:phage baseplate assembly protein W
MAYVIQNNNPLDLDYKMIIGVSIPFVGSYVNGSDAVFNATYTTNDQIKYDIINYVLTNKGERPLNPNYGGDIRKFVFQNIDGVNLNNLKTQLLDGLKSNFPNIVVNKITINPFYDTNSINININYSFAGSERTVDITL